MIGAVATLGGLVASALGLTALTRRVLFPGVEAPPDARPPTVESWWIDTPEGRVEAWFILGQDVSPTRPGPLVVLAHGNGETIDLWPAGVAPYLQRGISVLLPEYRGYGRSQGRPTEAAIVADATVFVERALARPEIDRRRLVLHGFSLGGGVVGQLARRFPPRALVLESTFTGVPEIVARWWIPSFMVRDRFETLPVVRDLDAEVLVVHGTGDRLIPVDHGRTLAAAARRGRLVLLEGGHVLPHTADGYWKPVLETLERAGVVSAPSTSERE